MHPLKTRRIPSFKVKHLLLADHQEEVLRCTKPHLTSIKMPEMHQRGFTLSVDVLLFSTVAPFVYRIRLNPSLHETMNAKVVAVKLPADFSLQHICVPLPFSRGRRKVTSLTADLAPASLHAYLKSGFGKTVPMSVFPESDAAA